VRLSAEMSRILGLLGESLCAAKSGVRMNLFPKLKTFLAVGV